MRLLKQFIYVFSEHRSQLSLLLAVFLFSSLLEAFGIGMIGAFINLASDPQQVINSPVFSKIYGYVNFESHEDFVVFAGILITVIFIVKSIFYFLGKFYTFTRMQDG